MATDSLALARRLSGLGLAVIPIEPGPEKRPAVKWTNFQADRPSDDNLCAWFGNGKAFNIGIVTGAVSNVVVVDTDSPESETWASEHLPQTPMRCLTARGTHRYYRHPGTPVSNRAKIRTTDGRLDLDIRGDGGFVVGPGSVHDSGHLYRAPEPWPQTLDVVPMFDQAWLAVPAAAAPPVRAASSSPAVAVVNDRDHLLKRARAYVAKVPPATEGQGGDAHTFQLACKLVRGFALSDSDALDLLRDWNQACLPPWSERELEEKIRAAGKYGAEPIGGRASTPLPLRLAAARSSAAGTSRQADASDDIDRAPQRFALTDTGNAEAFAAWYGDQWRFDHQQGIWRHWNTPIWEADADGQVYRDAKAAMRRRYREAEHIADLAERSAAAKWAVSSESKSRIEAFLFLGANEHPIADAGISWDEDKYLLACPNGVVDLRTAELRPGHQDDRLTMSTAVPYDPHAVCPVFERSMHEWAGHDQELVDYLHRALGYSITGDISEQCLHIPHGSGSGGKTTMQTAVIEPLGTYAYTAPMSTFLKDSQQNAATNDLAALRGKRMVIASEVQDKAKFDEGRVKSLTGGDMMTARFLHKEFFSFRPSLHLWIAVNHKPVVTDDSFGFWRRVRLVPFVQRFAVNPQLADDLRAEASGILTWLVRGCLRWQGEGLTPPACVLAATAQYEEDSDVLGDFLTDTCVLSEDASIGANEFYRLYTQWADQAGLGVDRLKLTAFGRLVSNRFRKERTSTGRLYYGVGPRRMTGLGQ